MSKPADAEQLLLRLEWTVIRRLDGLLHGDYRCFFRGPGIDLADLREYQYHDDVRHIDWNVTARMQTPYVRVFNEDRDLTAWFLLDLSASLDFGTRVKKQAVSAEFVGVLARLLTRHGNRVGALCYGSSVDTVVPARSGRRHGRQPLWCGDQGALVDCGRKRGVIAGGHNMRAGNRDIIILFISPGKFLHNL